MVQSKIIQNWEAQDHPYHFRTIRDRLLNDQKDPVTLLGLYRRVLTQGQLQTDNNFNISQLRLSGLVIDRENYLTVYNPIYGRIFNEDWVNAALDHLRPCSYTKNLTNWLKSHQRDKSQLLTGKVLEEALQWPQDKNLTDDDHLFLIANQKQANRQVIWKSFAASIGVILLGKN